jgi:hypothetical protein
VANQTHSPAASRLVLEESPAERVRDLVLQTERLPLALSLQPPLPLPPAAASAPDDMFERRRLSQMKTNNGWFIANIHHVISKRVCYYLLYVQGV